ncbi:MAG: hypothetical protein ACH255_21110, partial [Candidatus Thiodiazotropha sp.]
MATLSKCLRMAKSRINDQYIQRIRDLAREHKGDGMSPAEANIQAVDDVIEEAINAHNALVDQVAAKGVEVEKLEMPGKDKAQTLNGQSAALVTSSSKTVSDAEHSKPDAVVEKSESERLVEKLENGAKKSKSFDAYKSWANGFFGIDKARNLLKTGQLENTWSAVNPDNQASKEQIDEAASEAATSPKNDLPEPTDAQKEAGNYKVGKTKLHG